MRSRGQAVIGMLLLVLGAGAAVFFVYISPQLEQVKRDKITAAAMAEVKTALIGWAAAHSSKPGLLPCPDTDNDGTANAYVLSGSYMDCPSGIGRVPYKDLGIQEPKDGYGETLWYAVAPLYRYFSCTPASLCPLNSDTAGAINIGGLGTSNGLAAVIIAPGLPVANQDRTGAGMLNVANYLEGANADGLTPFETRIADPTFNDLMLEITTDNIFNVVTKRVAKEVVVALENYRRANGYLPRANRYNDPSGNCDPNATQGRLPLNLTTCDNWNLTIGPFTFDDPMSAWGPYLPAWYATNQWNLLTHYAVSEGCSGSINILGLITARTPRCATLDLGLLNALLGIGGNETPITAPYAGGTTNVLAAVLVSGRAMAGQTHTCVTVADCFGENGATVNSVNKNFALPDRYPSSNDKLAAICPAGSACQQALCPPNSATNACAFAP